MGVQVRFAKSDRAADIESLVTTTRARYFAKPSSILRQRGATSKRSPPSRIAIACRSSSTNTVPTPILVRPVDYGADVIVHSLTKIHGRPWHHARRHRRRLRHVLVEGQRRPLPHVHRKPDESYHGLVYTDHLVPPPSSAAAAACTSAPWAPCSRPINAFLLFKAIETVALRVERHVENASRLPNSSAIIRASESVNFAGFTDSPYYPLVQKYLRGKACSLMTFEIRGGLKSRHALLQRTQALQASGEFGRCEVARLPSGLDDAPANDVGEQRGRGGGTRRHPLERRESST